MYTPLREAGTKLLLGRSARVVVTMGMPAFIYRWYFGTPGLKSLTHDLSLVGISPSRSTLIGRIEAMDGCLSGAKDLRDRCRVRLSGPTMQITSVTSCTSGGRTWGFHYDIHGDPAHDEAAYRLGDHILVPRQYVSIKEKVPCCALFG